MTTRRVFMKLATAMVGGVAIATYAEPLALVKYDAKWVTDKGGYYIVRIPDYMTFAHEDLDKPTIFLLGEQSRVRDVSVLGFANIAAPNGGAIDGLKVDASKVRAQTPRHTVIIDGARHLDLRNFNILSPDRGDSPYDGTSAIHLNA
jgi:hypothetical protein